MVNIVSRIDNIEHKPKISVIMGIYNCGNTLAEAIDSILNQTFTDWELIMCDDGSTDDTYEIAKSYADLYPDRIVLIRNSKNCGLNHTLNNCLHIAKGEFIARMDGDDTCLPERFAVEVAELTGNPEIAIVSTDMGYFDESGIWGSCSRPDYPTPNDFMHGTPFCHAPCMVRKEAYDQVCGYTENKWLLRVEDYHLWLKMYAAGFRGKNIHQELYYMRDDRNAYSRRKFVYRLNEAYVRVLAIKEFKLPLFYYIYAMKPLIVGLLPGKVYDYLHKKNFSRRR